MWIYWKKFYFNLKLTYRIGEVFVYQTAEEALKLLEEMKTELEGDISRLDEETVSIKEVLGQLKVQLYAKFGNNINLEMDEDWPLRCTTKPVMCFTPVMRGCLPSDEGQRSMDSSSYWNPPLCCILPSILENLPSNIWWLHSNMCNVYKHTDIWAISIIGRRILHKGIYGMSMNLSITEVIIFVLHVVKECNIDWRF